MDWRLFLVTFLLGNVFIFARLWIDNVRLGKAISWCGGAIVTGSLSIVLFRILDFLRQ